MRRSSMGRLVFHSGEVSALNTEHDNVLCHAETGAENTADNVLYEWSRRNAGKQVQDT